MRYNKEDLKTDEDWLRGLGAETEEIREFIVNTIKSGFSMTKKEFVDFLGEVEE